MGSKKSLVQPVVLQGGGEAHYRLVQRLDEQALALAPIILVAQNMKLIPPFILPYVLRGWVHGSGASLDLWTACQRKGVYFLEDQALSVSGPQKTLRLKKFGQLKYHKLAVESSAQPTCLGSFLEPSPSVMDISQPQAFISRMEAFFAEIQKHCPREVRVVLSGYNSLSVAMAITLTERLKTGCERADIVIIDNQRAEKPTFFKSRRQRERDGLRALGVQVMEGVFIKASSEHLIGLQEGGELSYDIIIPCSHFQATDGFTKLLQGQDQSLRVEPSLVLGEEDPDLLVTGPHVYLKGEKPLWPSVDPEEVTQVLYHNLFKAQNSSPLLEVRQGPLKPWGGGVQGEEARVLKKLKRLRQVEVLEPSRQELNRALTYQAQHMGRPWQGRTPGRGKRGFQLHSFSGFNSWGSFGLSSMKITEMAILKSLASGGCPHQLRFNLHLPSQTDHLLQHIFESSFRGIEKVAERHGLLMEGGETFDGQHWHLNVVVGGETSLQMDQGFRPHDYLLINRPLGFGFLWAGRLNDPFDSSWIQAAMKESLLVGKEKMLEFLEKWKPSATVLIEEWGFLFHCLQRLSVDQQLMVNLRGVPRWHGTDFLMDKKVFHPGLDSNWERICEDLSFSREEVSVTNSVLWDSLSQGSLVFGLRPENWQEALKDLKEMGYGQAAFVGCIKPKTKGHPVVLSDWSPLET